MTPAGSPVLAWTEAAARRVSKRPFLRDRVAEVFAHPDSVEDLADGATRYTKRYDRRRISIKVRNDRRRRDLLGAGTGAAPLVVAVEQGRA